MSTLLYGGMYIFFAACAIGIFRGVAYDPVALFTPIANERLYTIVLLAGLGLWYSTLLQRMPPLATPGELRIIMRVATVLLLLTLLTAETRDWFEHRIWSLETTQSAQEELAALEEAKQLSLSGGWLLFSIGLMFVGLLRRARSLRILAIGLFGFAILKIFIYDLSFLDTIYRILSFLGLGVILLLASYLYQKYRSVILEPTREGPAGGAAA
jgi:uncharacterized membrane protein